MAHIALSKVVLGTDRMNQQTYTIECNGLNLFSGCWSGRKTRAYITLNCARGNDNIIFVQVQPTSFFRHLLILFVDVAKNG